MNARILFRVFSAFMLLVVGLGLAAPGGGALPAQAQANPDLLPYGPITIADFGPRSTNQPYVGWMEISRDWAAYGEGYPGCGHCQGDIGDLYLHNILTSQRIKIHVATLAPDLNSGSTTGATNIRFVDPVLVWQQPNGGSSPGYQFFPGDYNCAMCYYDLSTGTGGVWDGTPLLPPPAQADWDARYTPGPAYTVDVARHSTGQQVIHAQLPQGEQVEEIKTTLDAMLVRISDMRQSGGGYGALELLQVVWLTTPPPAFQEVWARADEPVARGTADRSWLWGPQANSLAWEPYAESPGGKRQVAYFDKSRMEVNNPNTDPAQPFFVSNGLLVVEMMSREVHVGDTAVLTSSIPADIPVAGDPRAYNPLTPAYAALAPLASLHGEHQAPNRTGQAVDDAVDVHGVVSKDPTGNAGLAHYAAFVPQTGHNIPDLFWSYLQGMQSTYGFDWTFVLGYPITEGYWTQMRVGGQDYPVLIQAYQRRVLTYAPTFPAAWRLQQGNVGQHYFEWRTRSLELKLPCADFPNCP